MALTLGQAKEIMRLAKDCYDATVRASLIVGGKLQLAPEYGIKEVALTQDQITTKQTEVDTALTTLKDFVNGDMATKPVVNEFVPGVPGE